MSARASGAWSAAQKPTAWLIALGYLAIYLVLDWASYIRPWQGLNITPWNPQPALAIGLLAWDRRWIWLVWAGLVTAEFVVRGIPANWLAAFATTVALSLTYAAVAKAIQQRTDLSHPLATRKDLGWFAAIATLGSLASALVYVLAYSAAGFGPNESLMGAIVRYWIGDAVGLVVTLPALLILMDRPSRSALFTTLRSARWWLTASLTLICLWIVFGRGEQDYFKYFYLLLLPIVWAAAQFGVAGAVLSALVTQLGLIAAAQLALRHDLTVFELQALMAASTVTALLLGVLVDERAHAAAELRGSLRFAAAGQMAAALAHELGQPLTALSNYAHACRALANGSQTLDAAQREHLSEITRNIAAEAQRAGDVVKRLRDFFKSGATSLQRVEPGLAIRDALQAHAAYAHRLDVAVANEMEPDLPAVWADPVQLAVVLRNLLANAIESASGAPGERRAWIRGRLDREGVLLEVHDSGPGVEPQRLQGLFEPRPSAKPGGMGVGLSICRAVVDAHGGKLWAEPGPGGHFLFTLPIDHHESSAAERTS